MKKILVVIDCQNDFIDGSLRNEEAIKKVPNIVNKIKENDWDIVFVTQDTHSKDYLETKEGLKLPVVHCVKNTQGWELNSDVKAALDEVAKNKVPVFIIEKPTFGSKKLVECIEQHFFPFNVETVNGEKKDFYVEVCGFCTDICVVSNVLMLKEAVYDKCDITVDASCCAGVTPESHKAALLTMKMCQINVIDE